jgi:hypothetical protein
VQFIGAILGGDSDIFDAAIIIAHIIGDNHTIIRFIESHSIDGAGQGVVDRCAQNEEYHAVFSLV